MTDGIDYDDYANPMRFSIRDRVSDIGCLEIDVTKLEIRPSEGSVYVHWEEP